MTERLRRWWHRLQHHLFLEPCELVEVLEDGALLVLRCTECGERRDLHYPPRLRR